jgi:hypothetical protein
MDQDGVERTALRIRKDATPKTVIYSLYPSKQPYSSAHIYLLPSNSKHQKLLS